MPEGCRHRGRRVARFRVGAPAPQVRGGSGFGDPARQSRAWPAASPSDRLRCRDRRLPGAVRHAARSPNRWQASAHFQSGDLALRRDRARSWPLEDELASRQVAEGVRPPRLPPGGPRRRGNRSQRRLHRGPHRSAARADRGVLPGSVGAALSTGPHTQHPVPLPVSRQAHPTPRARHDPRGRTTRSRRAVQDRGSRSTRCLLDTGVPPNVERVGWVERERIPAELWHAGCALGVFGTNDRVGRVFTNKAFEALACSTPLITADTPAARELLVDGESALLIPPGDPAALASAVESIAADPVLAERLSQGGRAAYEAQASRAVLGARWRSLLEELVAR